MGEGEGPPAAYFQPLRCFGAWGRGWESALSHRKAIALIPFLIQILIQNNNPNPDPIPNPNFNSNPNSDPNPNPNPHPPLEGGGAV